MVVELRRPQHVRVALAAAPRIRRRELRPARLLLMMAGRGLLVGFGLGVILTSGPHPGPAAVTAVLIALAVALSGWDE